MTNTPVTCLVNGAAAASVDSRDRGLAYGDGLFETLLARPDHLPQWPQHMARLSLGCTRLNLPQPDTDGLKSQALRLLAENGAGVIKIIVTRGSGGRGYATPGDVRPTRIMLWTKKPDWPDRPWQGIAARQCALQLGAQPALAGIKHLNRMEQVLARQEWTDSNIREGLLCDASGNLIEAVSSNVLAVFGKRIVVPTLNQQGVAGIMQQRLFQALDASTGEFEFTIEIRELPWNEALEAESIICTNAVAGCWPITRLQINAGQKDVIKVFSPPRWLPELQQQFDKEDGLNRHCDSSDS